MRTRATVALVALLTGIAAQAGAAPGGAAHLPDLQLAEPSDIEVVRSGSSRLLRFSTTILNLGEGPMEVRPVHDEAAGVTRAVQNVYSHDDSGMPVLAGEHPAGAFEFHPDHDHWHLGGVARFELRSLGRRAGIGHRVVASSDKVGFCLFDTEHVRPGLEHSPDAPVYRTCGPGTAQGISVGWGDTYVATLPGQSLDVTRVRWGLYWLVMTVNPDGVLLESDDTNNVAAVMVHLGWDRVRRIQGVQQTGFATR